MKKDETTRTLFFASIIAVIFDFARFYIGGTIGPLYLIWNLFLAWIPYVLSFFFAKKDMSLNYFLPIFFLWLLFFPNAPYLVTDVLHLASRLSPLLWYDGLLFFFFGWLGLLLGMLSLFQIHQYFKNRFNYLISELAILGICFVASVGVYLGRFERWNSWDVFINPFQLLKHSLIVSNSFLNSGSALVFVIVFSVFMYAVYRTIYFIKIETNQK